MRPSSLTNRWFTCAIGLILIFGFLGYGNSFHVPFQFDDHLLIAENYLIKSLNNLDWLLTYDPSRFLTHLSFALNFHFGRLDVFGYHIVNFLLHVGVTVLVYLLFHYTLSLSKINRLNNQNLQLISLFSTLIFLVHPLQTQAVTYISQRSTLLASLCYLGALLFYIVSRLNSDFKFYSLAVVTMFLGIFTKPIIVTLPLVFLLYEIFFFNFQTYGEEKGSPVKKKDIPKVLLGILPFVMMALMVPLFIMAWKYKTVDIERYVDMTRETQAISRGHYMLTQLNVMMTYLRLLFLPIHQNLDYDYPIAKSFFDFPTWLSFIVLVGILLIAFKLFHRQRLLAFGLFWMAISLSLESSIFPITDVINEHRLYPALIGFALFISLGINKFFKQKQAYLIFMSVIVLTLCWLTFQRNHVWSDRIGLLLDVAKKSPHKSRVYNNLGIGYGALEKLPEAEAAYKRAIELNPTFAPARNNLANIYFKQGRLDEAAEELKEALELDPDYAGAYYNLGNVNWVQGHFAQAHEYYAKAVQLSPSFVYALVAVGKSCRLKGDFKRSEFVLQAAVNIDPTYEGAYVNLGDLYLTLGDYKKALRQYQVAIRYTAQPAILLNNIGNIYDIYGDYEQAQMMYKEAIWRDPEYAHAYFNLANSLKKIGDFEQAKFFLEKASGLYTQQGNEGMAKTARQRLAQLNK